MTIGLVGVGQMGLAMARRRLDAGHTVIGYRRGSLEELIQLRGTPAESAAAVPEATKLLICSLPDSKAM